MVAGLNRHREDNGSAVRLVYWQTAPVSENVTMRLRFKDKRAARRGSQAHLNRVTRANNPAIRQAPNRQLITSFVSLGRDARLTPKARACCSVYL